MDVTQLYGGMEMAVDQKDILEEAMLKDVEDLEQQFRRDSSPEVYIPLGKIYLKRGDPFRAITVAQKGLKGDSSLEGELLLAQAYFDASARKRPHLKKAAAEVERILEQHPESWAAHCLSGEIALEEDDLQAAVTSLQKSNELNPIHPQARMLLKSLGAEVVDAPPSPNGFFHINVDTSFFAMSKDGLLKTFRDIAVVLFLALIVINIMAKESILEKRIHALVFLGRSQQQINTYSGTKNAIYIYQTIRDKYDQNYPFALLHLAESYYTLWSQHNRSNENLAKFRELFTKLQNTAPKKLLSKLTQYHTLVAIVQYTLAQKLYAEGKNKEAQDELRKIESYLKKHEVNLPPNVRVPWLKGLIYEGLGKPRYAKANFKKAADTSLYNPMYRWRLGMAHLRQREFASAHLNFSKASEQAQQNTVLVKRILSAPDKQKNEYCWIDPPVLIKGSAPPGLNLSMFDLLTESLSSALKSDNLSKCPFHGAIQKEYKASPYYLMAPIADALSVLESGVGMSVGFQMVLDLKKEVEKVKKLKDLSPRIHGWYYYVQAKSAFYQEKYETALKLVLEAEKLTPDEAYIYSLHGLVLFKLKKFAEGMKSIQKAILVDPMLVQTYYEGAETLLSSIDSEGKATQNDNVEKLLTSMKKTFDGHTDYLYLAGKLAFNSDDKKKAQELWKKALDESKAPYYGDHYEANLEMGKLYMKRARKIGKKRKFGKKDYAELLPKFKKDLKGIFKKIDDRLVKKKDNERAKADYNEFLKKLADGKRINKKQLLLRIGDLREVYYEVAGGHFEQAMKIRPGVVESRLWTGLIYFENGSWADSIGHFSLAAKGFLRDYNYSRAKQAFSLIGNALIGQVFGDKRKTYRKKKEATTKIKEHFERELSMLLRPSYATMKAKKKKKISKEKLEHFVRSI